MLDGKIHLHNSNPDIILALASAWSPPTNPTKWASGKI